MLDPGQALLRTYDEANDAVRVEINATSMALSLDAATGDNVATVQSNATNVSHLTHSTTGTNTVVLGPVNVYSFSKAAIYLQSTTALAESNISVQLQVSPDDSAPVWINVGTPVTASQSLNGVVMSTPVVNMVARRAQLVISGAIASAETLDAYLVLGT